MIDQTASQYSVLGNPFVRLSPSEMDKIIEKLGIGIPLAIFTGSDIVNNICSPK